jgi:hypothetical protein
MLSDLDDTDKAILAVLLRAKITADPYPLSPRVQRLRVILDKLVPSPPRLTPYPRPKPAGTPSLLLSKKKQPRLR